MTNDEIYHQYKKLIYYVIHRWTNKPQNFDIEDASQSVLCKLFSIPEFGTRRTNKSYINTVIQTEIQQYITKLRTINHNEELELHEYEDYESPSKIHFDIDANIMIQNIISTLSLDEQIVIMAFLELNYKRRCYSVKEISRLIYKNKEDTQKILDEALVKIKDHLEN